MATTTPQSPGQEQVQPLAPAVSGHSHRADDVENGGARAPPDSKAGKKRKCIKCCACCSVVTLIIILVILILAFTVFRVKDPTVRMDSIQIEGLSSLTTRNLNPNVNLTLFAGVSVKNPNAASFRFDEATMSLLYDGRVVGEAQVPPGNARARRTLKINATVIVMVQNLMGVPRLGSDLIAGKLPVGITTRIHGRAKVLGIIKKSATVRLNCTMSFDLSSQGIENLDCDRKVSL
nr:late embryogenesis abundant protein At1g64065-like [Ipomoea batatas]